MKRSVKTIAIVAGGKLDKQILKDISRTDFIIGVDRGAAWLLQHEITPDVAVGDFDSVSQAEFQKIKSRVAIVKEYPAEKDKTDLELAVDESIKLHPKEVVIYGAIGTRFDHTLATIGLLLKLESYNIYGQIVDNFNKIYIVRHQQFIKASPYRYLSIIPLSDHAIITLSGFVYNASRLKLLRMSTRGVSNKIKGSRASIAVHAGSILVIWSSDRSAMGAF